MHRHTSTDQQSINESLERFQHWRDEPIAYIDVSSDNSEEEFETAFEKEDEIFDRETSENLADLESTSIPPLGNSHFFAACEEMENEINFGNLREVNAMPECQDEIFDRELQQNTNLADVESPCTSSLESSYFFESTAEMENPNTDSAEIEGLNTSNSARIHRSDRKIKPENSSDSKSAEIKKKHASHKSSYPSKSSSKNHSSHSSSRTETRLLGIVVHVKALKQQLVEVKDSVASFQQQLDSTNKRIIEMEAYVQNQPTTSRTAHENSTERIQNNATAPIQNPYQCLYCGK